MDGETDLKEGSDLLEFTKNTEGSIQVFEVLLAHIEAMN